MMLLFLLSEYYINSLLRYDFSFKIARFLAEAIGIVLAVPASVPVFLCF